MELMTRQSSQEDCSGSCIQKADKEKYNGGERVQGDLDRCTPPSEQYQHFERQQLQDNDCRTGTWRDYSQGEYEEGLKVAQAEELSDGLQLAGFAVRD